MTNPMTAHPMEPSRTAAGDAPYFARRMAKIKGYSASGYGPMVRAYQCCDCFAPGSAVRKGTRCKECQAKRRRAYDLNKGRGPQPSGVLVHAAKPKSADSRPWYENDEDVARYRAERARKAKRDALSDADVQAAIEETRAMLATESERTPRKRTITPQESR